MNLSKIVNLDLDLDLFVGCMSDQDLKKGQMIPYKIVPQFAN